MAGDRKTVRDSGEGGRSADYTGDVTTVWADVDNHVNGLTQITVKMLNPRLHVKGKAGTN